VTSSPSRTPAPFVPTLTPTATPGGAQLVRQPTQSATATPGPTERGATPTPSPAVAAVSQAPQPEETDPAAAVADEPSAGERARPALLRDIPPPTDLVTRPGVVSTNIALAMATIIVMLATAAIFNNTLEENDHIIRGWFEKIWSPFSGVVSGFSLLGGALAEKSWMRILIGPLVVVSLAAVLYALEEPSFGFNDETVILTLSFMSTFVVLTYVYDGGQLVVTNYYGLPGTIRIFPAGVLMAVICVALTRIQGFQPGLVFGFVAAHALTAPVMMTKRQKGMQILWPILALLATAVIAWLAIEPAREIAKDGDTMWSALPESVAVGIFLAGIQSAFLMMIPIKFMDGHKLMEWNKFAWGGVAIVSGFIFWHAMMNEEKESLEALGQTGSATFIALIFATLFVALATHTFFRFKNRHAEHAV
jgi:hypothetical protein